MPKQKEKTNNSNNKTASNGTVKNSSNKTMANGNHSPVAASAASAAGNSMSVKKQNTRDKEKMQREREKIVLWRRPIQTLKYCTLECFALLQYYGIKWVNKAVIGVF